MWFPKDFLRTRLRACRSNVARFVHTRLNAGPRVLELDSDAVIDGRVVPAGVGRAGRRIVSCGNLVGATKVAIVNPENLTKCRADEIGEIWVSDPGVASGY